jgi:hypothetical protein
MIWTAAAAGGGEASEARPADATAAAAGGGEARPADANATAAAALAGGGEARPADAKAAAEAVEELAAAEDDKEADWLFNNIACIKPTSELNESPSFDKSRPTKTAEDRTKTEGQSAFWRNVAASNAACAATCSRAYATQ